MDWQVGDLAICVAHASEADETNPLMSLGGDTIETGEVHQVTRITYDFTRAVGIGFAGPQSNYPTGEYCASAFRKIRPDKLEACEPEFITLLKRLEHSNVPN